MWALLLLLWLLTGYFFLRELARGNAPIPDKFPSCMPHFLICLVLAVAATGWQLWQGWLFIRGIW